MLVFFITTVAHASDIVVEQTVTPRTPIFVGLSSSGTLSATVRNDGTAMVPVATLRAIAPSLPNPPVWTFGLSASPRCSQMRFVQVPTSGLVTFPAWEFDVTELAPGDSVSCEYSLDRGPTAVNDLLLVFNVVTPANDPGPMGNQATWVAGSLTHVELAVSEACDMPATATSRTMRVSLSNRGPTGLNDVSFGACLDNFSPAFRINGNVPDGCGSGNLLPFICLDAAMGWSIASLDAGETKSCLLRLEALQQPNSGRDPFSITFREPYRSGPLRVLDLEPDGGGALVSLAAASTCALATPVHIPSSGIAWIIATICSILIVAVARSVYLKA